MDINKIKYILVGDYVVPAITNDEFLNEFNLEERTKICAKRMYYERLVQTIKDEKKDYLFKLCDYDLGVIDDAYIPGKKRNNTNDTEMIDSDAKRYVTVRDNLVNNFINCSYDLEIISKSFNNVTKTTYIKTIEYYVIERSTNEYYDLYDVFTPHKRYLDYELRKIVKEKIDSANNYEFDSAYLTYGEKRVILTLYV